jgi:hypothetical protein
MTRQPAGGAGLLSWLESTAPAVWARESALGYPAVEVAHILGFTVLVGAAVAFDLRLLGFGRAIPARAAARHLLGLSRWSLLLVVPTGVLLFATQATATWANPAFRLKLVLIAAAGVNALAFRLWSRDSMDAWGDAGDAPLRAKAAAVVSLLLWAAVIACGRFIAYV